mmetsp:Transcript_5805/g.6305  ORF Transcript_5805/g.6305 Transcript_5805/m.6305 type:complete len:175 (-) Transcript_5805:107-631(-)
MKFKIAYIVAVIFWGVAIAACVLGSFGELYIDDEGVKQTFYSTRANLAISTPLITIDDSFAYADLDCGSLPWVGDERDRCVQLKAAGFTYLGLLVITILTLIVTATLLFIKKLGPARTGAVTATIFHFLAILIWCAVFPYQSNFFDINKPGYGIIIAGLGWVATLIGTILSLAT